MTDKILVMSTCDSADEARKLASKLVEVRLAACVSIVPRVESVYHWQGQVQQSEEWLLLIKTSRELFDHLAETLRTMHSYTVPEIIAVPMVAASESYLAWLDRELESGTVT